MRVDANVSVRKPGEPFGTRCEIKNVNSSARSAGRSSTRRGARSTMLEHGEPVRQETRHWDENDGRTHTLRDKEDADDYRYFLEPDLVPLAPSPAVDRAGARRELPMLPAARRGRLAEVTGVARDSEAVDGRSSSAARTTTCSRSAPPAATPAAPLVHVKEAFAEQVRRRPCRPPTSPR